METRFKISMFWMLIGIGMILHMVFGTVGLFYGQSVAMPDATGEVPGMMYGLMALTMVVPFIFVFIHLLTTVKWFNRVALVWSILLIILNLAHLIITVFVEKAHVDQGTLLLFVLIVNVFFTKELYKFIKSSRTVN